jgi:hypothetical protein
VTKAEGMWRPQLGQRVRRFSGWSLYMAGFQRTTKYDLNCLVTVNRHAMDWGQAHDTP